MAAAVRVHPDKLAAFLRGNDIARELSRAAIRVEHRAKQLCPVDTGRLRSSITWALATDSVGLLAIIGSNVHYAAYVEFGTSRARAQPFLRPALQAVRGA